VRAIAKISLEVLIEPMGRRDLALASSRFESEGSKPRRRGLDSQCVGARPPLSQVGDARKHYLRPW
jgi:hypothetical protein